jgi:hypothetical protein
VIQDFFFMLCDLTIDLGKLVLKSLKNVFKKELNIILTSFTSNTSFHVS